MSYLLRDDAEVDSCPVASKIETLFRLNLSEVEDEILTLQAEY